MKYVFFINKKIKYAFHTTSKTMRMRNGHCRYYNPFNSENIERLNLIQILEFENEKKHFTASTTHIITNNEK